VPLAASHALRLLMCVSIICETPATRNRHAGYAGTGAPWHLVWSSDTEKGDGDGQDVTVGPTQLTHKLILAGDGHRRQHHAACTQQPAKTVTWSHTGRAVRDSVGRVGIPIR
jgi:hypothetical protein